jgi:hypothetical protein
MAAGDTLYDRNSYLTFNSTSGNDPLTDKLSGQFSRIGYSQVYRVNKLDEFRPDKLAAKIFGDSNLYWVILEYNNLTSFSDLETGLEIKIPDTAALNSLLLSGNKQVTINTIYIK